MTTTVHGRDHLIQEDVEEELAWAPQVKDELVGVSVTDGVVTLSGEVDSYAERDEAKNAALRVAGVSVVANELEVRGSGGPDRSDTDVAAAVKHTLDWSVDLPHGAVKAEVRDHVVTLSGTVTWDYERATAERLVRGLSGVAQIVNHIELSARVSSTDTAKRIKSALVRHALVDANAITVSTVGSEVTLTGGVSTWAERNAAVHAAWASPHVTAVHNKIVIRT